MQPLPSSRLSFFVSLCLVASTLAQTPQDSYAVPNHLVSGTHEQILEAPYTFPNFVPPECHSWPDPATWEAFNKTLDGRLQVLRPWAAVCYTKDPLYDPAKCKTVLSNYTNYHTRESIPSALLWTNWESCGYDNGCALNYSNPQPVTDKPCYQGTTPPYSIAVTSAQDVSVVVKWATAHKVKLTVKSTGHDFTGRSSGPCSLQVFTHLLNDIDPIPDFVPQGSHDPPVLALRLSAGAQVESIYPVLEKLNVSAMLGDCLTVSAAGGFIQAGGYNAFSPAYGLASEYVLEVEIVTADGAIRKINAVQDPDLFWATRGGGAGSWGIVISITIGTLPSTAVNVTFLAITPNQSQDTRALDTDFVALLGKHQNRIVDSGISSFALFLDGKYNLNFVWPVTKTSMAPLYPFFDELRALSSNYTVKLNTTQEYPTLPTAMLKRVGPTQDKGFFYGGSLGLASRFVPESMLEDPESIQNVAKAIQKGMEISLAPLKDHLPGILAPQPGVVLTGRMPAATKDRVNTTGANPGFYGAAWHVLYFGAWTLGTSKETYDSLKQAVYDAVGPLTDLGLTASFQNEGSAWEKDWKQSFFGYKYDELLEVKQKYDPHNFFTTWQGVGSTTESPAFECYHRD